MLTMAIPSQVSLRESAERKPWTAQDGREICAFLAQSLALVGVAIFLYSLGVALGMTLLAVSLAVWSLLRSQIASEEEEGHGADDRDALSANWPSNRANPACSRNGRLGRPSAVQRQGA